MKRMITAAAAAALALASVSGAALAQPGYDRHDGPPGHGAYGPPGHMDDHGRNEHARDDHGRDDHGGPRGHDHGHWRKGDRIEHVEWRHYQRVDWRHHHLHAPPRGYEWREVNGDYVLAAVATGLIVSIIAGQ
jgi:Ni/Co efflux regulator RcnB